MSFRINSGVHHVSFALQCIYVRSDEGGEDEDGEEESEFSGRRERMEIDWHLECR